MMNTSHLTPKKILSKMPVPQRWSDARIAFVCYTPFPQQFSRYVEEISTARTFLHSPKEEVHLCSYKDIPFLVISEVYGFPVGATTVEELIFRGVDTIIGIGYAGAFDSVPMGKKFIAIETISDLPLAYHYGVAALEAVKPHASMFHSLMEMVKEDGDEWGRYRVWNSNSLYREYPDLVERMKGIGCNAVNMDVLSLYAVAPVCARETRRDIQYIYVGTVTDASSTDGENWRSDLSDIVSGKGKNPHDELVKFMVEIFLPSIKIRKL